MSKGNRHKVAKIDAWKNSIAVKENQIRWHFASDENFSILSILTTVTEELDFSTVKWLKSCRK